MVFTDIVGFTPWAQRTGPARIVALLDDLFSRFDTVAAEHGIEKIKTVGDATWPRWAPPGPRGPRAGRVASGGRSSPRSPTWRSANDIDLQVRVGVASGPVVGGVIGQRRIVFDLWGDTVNTAARMESSGVPGQIHLAASTRELLGGNAIEARQVDVKGSG